MEDEQRTKLRDTVNGLRLNRKSYSRVGPLAERLLRTFSEAVFILTRNCSSNLRPLVSLNQRSLLQFIERRVPDGELHRFPLTSSLESDCGRETGLA
jgi:hypothetical protein